MSESLSNPEKYKSVLQATLDNLRSEIENAQSDVDYGAVFQTLISAIEQSPQISAKDLVKLELFLQFVNEQTIDHNTRAGYAFGEQHLTLGGLYRKLSETLNKHLGRICLEDYISYCRQIKYNSIGSERPELWELIFKHVEQPIDFKDLLAFQDVLPEDMFIPLLSKVANYSIEWQDIFQNEKFYNLLATTEYWGGVIRDFLRQKTKEFDINEKEVVDNLYFFLQFPFVRELILKISQDYNGVSKGMETGRYYDCKKYYSARHILESFAYIYEGISYWHRRPYFFQHHNQVAIGRFFQQGSDIFFDDLSILLKEIPNGVQSFPEQYHYLEEITRPDMELQSVSRKKYSSETLVYYYRFNRDNSEWQGVDILQTAMILQDALRMIRDKFVHFEKLVITPRSDNDFPYFVLPLFEKEFGREFLNNHLQFDNHFHYLESKPNAYFINMVDGSLQKGKPGITSVINHDKINQTGAKYVEVPIFWPSHTERAGFMELAQDGKTNLPNVYQPKTLKETREVMVEAIKELDNITG